MRVDRIARRALALLDDRRESRERGLQTHDVPRTRQIDLLGRELQRPIAVESVRLAAVRHQGAQALAEGHIKVADGLVVDAHGSESRPAGAAAHVAALVGKAAAFLLRGVARTLEKHEVLQGVGIEGRELDHHARRQKTRIEREIRASEARTAAQPRGNVPHRREVAHLLDRHPEQHLTPAAYGRGFLGAEPLALTVLEAGRGVQVRAHEVVLELRGLVKRVQQDFALREGGPLGNVVHGDLRRAYVAQIGAPRHPPESARLRSRRARASRGK